MTFTRNIIILFLLTLPLIPASLCADTHKPNIIVIMADDLGYGDLSCYGATTFKTPNIDQLAASGQRFTSGYCSASTCTPTRYSLLTGKYAFRKSGTGIAPPNGHLIIDQDTLTLPDLMKNAGYQTGVIGKWHLGLGKKGTIPNWNGELTPGPRELGFDYHFLLPTTNDRVPQVYVTDSHVLNLDPADPLWVGSKRPSPDHPTGKSHRNSLTMDWSHGHNGTIHNGISRIGFYTGGEKARFRDEDLADKWVEKSNAFIEQNKDKPFFLFYAAHDIHVPRIPHERFQGVTPHGFRADSIVQFDWTVGEIMKTLDRLDLTENTLIVLCSDNGPVMDDGYKDGAIEKLGDHKAAGPYKGGKYSLYEGGTRTPFITSWKGHIPAGTSEQIVCTIDLAASLAGLTGTPVPKTACGDSKNIINALLGKPKAKGRTSLIQQDNGGKGNYGYRSRNWKLTRHSKKSARNTIVAEKLSNKKVQEFQLFNLATDPSEKTNIMKEHPEEAKRLKQELQALIDAGHSR